MEPSWLPFVLFPLVGALIGWCTNWLAVKMIFRPRTPRRILGIKIQGLLPKRRSDLAVNVAATVERDLISVEQIQEVVRGLIGGEKVRPLLHARVDKLIDEQIGGLNPMVKAFISTDLLDKVKSRIEEEILDFVETLSGELHDDLAKHIDIHEMVRSRIEGFDMDRLEEIVFRIAASELRHIEILGGVLGFIVGLIEAGLIAVL